VWNGKKEACEWGGNTCVKKRSSGIKIETGRERFREQRVLPGEVKPTRGRSTTSMAGGQNPGRNATEKKGAGLKHKEGIRLKSRIINQIQKKIKASGEREEDAKKSWGCRCQRKKWGYWRGDGGVRPSKMKGRQNEKRRRRGITLIRRY